jgi:hypothetical protein
MSWVYLYLKSFSIFNFINIKAPGQRKKEMIDLGKVAKLEGEV